MCWPGHTSAPAGPTPPAGPCVWRLLQLRCAPATVRLWVIHIRTVAGLLPGAQLGIVTAAAPTICQPSSTANTVAILAQGTKWADALPQAFFQTAASDSATERNPGHPPWEFSGLATRNFCLNGCPPAYLAGGAHGTFDGSDRRERKHSHSPARSARNFRLSVQSKVSQPTLVGPRRRGGCGAAAK